MRKCGQKDALLDVLERVEKLELEMSRLRLTLQGIDCEPCSPLGDAIGDVLQSLGSLEMALEGDVEPGLKPILLAS